MITIPRNYGYGKTRSKKIGKYKVEIEFHAFKKARFDIYEGKKMVYFTSSDILPDNKEKMLNVYRSLKTGKGIGSFIKKRNAIE